MWSSPLFLLVAVGQRRAHRDHQQCLLYLADSSIALSTISHSTTSSRDDQEGDPDGLDVLPGPDEAALDARVGSQGGAAGGRRRVLAGPGWRVLWCRGRAR